MSLSPDSLQNICLDFVASSMSIRSDCCCEEGSERKPPSCAIYRSLHYTDNFYLQNSLADELLSRMSQRKTLCCETLEAFTPKSACLRHVRIRSATPFHRALRTLRFHPIVDLSYEDNNSHKEKAVVNRLIGCLGEWSRINLRSLSVAGCSFRDTPGISIVISLTSLRGLRMLNVSRTDFNDHMLSIVVAELPNLEGLDISASLVNNISPLAKCSSRLRYLAMFNIPFDNVEVLWSLSLLEHLDISWDKSSTLLVSSNLSKFRVNSFLDSSALSCSRNKNLVHLDISGKDDVNMDLLGEFVNKHHHLKFLGMFTTGVIDGLGDVASFMEQHQNHIKFTGTSNIDLLIESINRYMTRQPYMRTCLYELFNHLSVVTEPRIDLIKLILLVMRYHATDIPVQMAGTACLYNLLKGELSKSVHVRHLSDIVDHILEVMTNLLNRQQLMKNCLLILCHDRILQDVNFDRYRCAMLVFECLLKHDDTTICRLSVAICGILGSKIPKTQSAQLGGCRQYMRKLLSIIDSKIQARTIDITLKFTLSTLWNLSDEAPATCEAFVAESGIQVYLRLLETFKQEPEDQLASIEVKMLGFLNNMAEVEHLRQSLMEDKIISIVRELLKSEHCDVSYFSGGIFAHLLCSKQDWSKLGEITRLDMLRELEEAVTSWKQPEQEMVAYRSFAPFFQLLDPANEAPIQMWALWAWRHVCGRNSSRYCPLLIDEGGIGKLQSLLDTSGLSTDRPFVAKLASDVLQLIMSAAEGRRLSQKVDDCVEYA